MNPNTSPQASSVITENRNLYDDYYDKPDWWWTFRYATQVKRKTCLHMVRCAGRSLKSQSVLEIGFGCGSTLFSFDKSCEVFGLEMSTSAIERAEKIAARKKYRFWQFAHVEEAKFPYESERFDIVIASHVIEHVEDDQLLLDEIRRVLKPDGIAVILIPINEKYADPKHMRHYDSQGFAKIVRRLNYKIVHQQENEILFRLAEWYYLGGGRTKMKQLGAIFAAGFNFTTSLWPYELYAFVDRVLSRFGQKPRQAGFVIATGTEGYPKTHES